MGILGMWFTVSPAVEFLAPSSISSLQGVCVDGLSRDCPVGMFSLQCWVFPIYEHTVGGVTPEVIVNANEPIDFLEG